MRYEDRFTERAKKALNLAYSAAAELGHSYIGSEHILLGLSREGGGIAAKVLREAGLDGAFIQELIERMSAAAESAALAEDSLPAPKG